MKQLLVRIFDFKRIVEKRWYAVILLLALFIFLLSIGGILLCGTKIPPAMAPFIALPAVFLFFILLAAGEEVGWMGYAFEPLQTSGGALKAALVLGMIWAIWHIPFFVFMMPDIFVFTTQVLTLVGTRVLIAWIFNNTGNSVFAAILFHGVDNTALVTLPDIKAIIPWGSVLFCSLVLFAAFIVTLLWGGKTLKLFRFRKQVHHFKRYKTT